MSTQFEEPPKTLDTVLPPILDRLEDFLIENQGVTDLLREIIDIQTRQTEVLEDLLRQGQK